MLTRKQSLFAGNQLLILAAGLVAFPAIAEPPACPASVFSSNRISRPAHGNLDEIAPDTKRVPLHLPTRLFNPRVPIPDWLGSINDVNWQADQCRAVLGEIPRVSCPDGRVVPVTVNGKRLDYHDGTLFEDGAPTGATEIKNCDRPALLPLLTMSGPNGGADPSESCLPNVRIGRIRRGNVDWLFNCHYFKGLHEPTGDKFNFIALIGSNRLTGETCFFTHDDFTQAGGPTDGIDVIPPGGDGPSDIEGRARAAKFWMSPAFVNCMHCHAANSPWLVTPHLNQSRLEGDGTMDIIPSDDEERKLTPGTAYRMIGTVQNQVQYHPKAIYPKNDDGTEDRTCTRCHLLGDTTDFLRLARESVGLDELPNAVPFTRGFAHTRDPWMPAGFYTPGDDWTRYRQAVARYQRAMERPEFRFREREMMSPCPIPPALPPNAVRIATDGLGWNYANDLGGVPERDDVRFEVKVEGPSGQSCTVMDLAPEALGSTQWRFHYPMKNQASYRFTLRPYRYCFDRKLYEYGAPITLAPKDGNDL